MTDPILITGGATRLGFALADYYLNSGQSVVITFRSHRPQVQELLNRGAVCVQADFSTDSGIYEAAGQLKDRCPRLRSIVHNASSWFTDPGGTERVYTDLGRILLCLAFGEVQHCAFRGSVGHVLVAPSPRYVIRDVDYGRVFRLK